MLTGGSIRLRPLAGDDRALYRRLYNSPDVMRAIGTPLAFDAADAQFERMVRHNAARAPGHRTWVIEPVDGGGPAGLAALHRIGQDAEIGFMVLPEAQRTGIARRALAAMLPHTFADLRIEWLEARSRSNLDGLFLPAGFRRGASGDALDFLWRLARPATQGR